MGSARLRQTQQRNRWLALGGALLLLIGLYTLLVGLTGTEEVQAEDRMVDRDDGKEKEFLEWEEREKEEEERERRGEESENDDDGTLLALTDAEVAFLAVDPATLLTVEYSFKVAPELFLDRPAGLSFYLDLVQEHMGITKETHGPVKESTRCESAYRGVMKTCKIKNLAIVVRVRSYIAGFRAGTQTMDLKVSYTEYPLASEVTKASLRVAEGLERKEKFERDQHICNAKYSREGRVLDLPFDYTLEKCGDLWQFYPDLVVGLPEADAPPKSEGWLWWVWQVDGVVTLPDANGNLTEMEYQLTLTLQYKGGCLSRMRDLDPGIVAQKPSSKSEFSIRLFSQRHGRGPWPSAVLTMDERYQALSAALADLGLIGMQDLEC